LYPAEGRHPVDPEFLGAPRVRFVVARLSGKAIGCVALVLAEDGTAELRTMIVLPEFRGQGAGSRLLRKAEDIAASEAVETIRLETGPHNLEAISLYRRNGYCERGPFGSYEAGPHSAFMEKQLVKRA
jgi:putative acetyltransferase